MNLLEVPVVDGGVHFGDMVYPVERAALSGAGDRVTLGVRPEDLQPAEWGLDVELELVEELGADAYLYGKALGTGSADNPITPAAGQAVDPEGDLLIIARTFEDPPPEKGRIIRLAPKPGRVHLFDPGSGLRLDAHEPAGSART